MLLAWCDRVGHEAEDRLDVDREAGARLQCDPVEEKAEETPDLLRGQVVADLAALLQVLHVRKRSPVELDVASLPPLAELRVRAQAADVLDVDAEPVRALARDLVQERGETALEPCLDDPRLVGSGQ